MAALALIGVSLTLTVAAAGREQSIVYKLLETPAATPLHPTTIPGLDSSKATGAWEFQLPGDLIEASVDAPRDRLLIAYRDPAPKSKKHSHIVSCVDLRNGELRWSAHCRAPRIQLLPSGILVHSDDSLLVVGAEDGVPLWGREEVTTIWGFAGTGPTQLLAAVRPFPRGASAPDRSGTDRFYPGAKAEISSPTHTVIALDGATGSVIWDRDITSEDPLDWIGFDSGRVYFAADGVGALDLAHGSYWYTPRETRSSGGSLALIGNVLGAAVWAGFGGGVLPEPLFPDPNYEASMTHHLGSRPLIDGDDVYVADKGSVARLRGQDGHVVWETALPHECGFTRLYDLGPRILVLGSGWKFIGSRIEAAKHAFAAILVKESGAVVAVRTQKPADERFVFRNGRREQDRNPQTFLDASVWAGHIVLLSPAEISVRDQALEPVATLPGNEYGTFLHFVEGTRSPLLVRTTNGVLALTDDARSVRWWSEIPPVKILHKEKPLTLEEAFKKGLPFQSAQGPPVVPKNSWREMAWVARADPLYAASVVAGDFYVTPSNHGFVAVNVRTGTHVGGYQPSAPWNVIRAGPGYLSFASPRQIAVVRFQAKE